MIFAAVAAVAAVAANSDSPPRRPTSTSLAQALTSFGHARVAAIDLRNIRCEGLFYFKPWPMNYACTWDQRIGNDWRSFSSYFEFKSKRWSLSHKPATDLPAPTSAEELRFRQWLIPHLRTEAAKDEEPHKLTIRYGYALVDLNDDGRNEAIVWWMSDHNCGSGGCGLEVEVQRHGGWQPLSYSVRTRPPIETLPTKHRGWHDIGVFDAGGGILPGFESRLRFNGREYEGSPTDRPLPKRNRGRIALTYETANRPLF